MIFPYSQTGDVDFDASPGFGHRRFSSSLLLQKINGSLLVIEEQEYLIIFELCFLFRMFVLRYLDVFV